jgi:hypothetical protein
MSTYGTSLSIQPTVPVTLMTESRANQWSHHVPKHSNGNMSMVQEWIFSTHRC